MFLRRVRSFAPNFKRFDYTKVSPENKNVEQTKLKTIKSDYSLSNDEKRVRKIYQYTVSQRPFLRWFVFGTITAGTALYIWQIFAPDYRSEIDPVHYYSDWKIRLYISLPLNALSKFVGFLAKIEIPVSLRETVYGSFVNAYGCRMDEVKEESLNAYKSFSDFFNRELKPETRPISNSTLVSPADGKVLHFGKLTDNRVEYVKGYDFELNEFLGPINTNINKGNSLYQVVIYLSPSDYHAFHSPAYWNVVEKIHHPGYFLSVQPAYLDWIPKLFCMNERVVLSGNWKYGYFSMSAVAATNVGDIVINSKSSRDRAIYKDQDDKFIIYDQNFILNPGAKVGEFRLGSTIVLIFEAPSDLKFCIKAGDVMRYGQSLIV